MEKNIGIVLKTYMPSQCKISLLDKTLGKISGIPTRTDISNGICIAYFTQKNKSVYFIQNIEIIDMPFALAQQDILFLHHVLELCYYFVPVGSRIPRLSEALIALYTHENIFRTTRTKKVFLFQLFTIIGMYPEESAFQTPFFHKMALTSIDTLEDQALDLINEQQLDAWLLRCIAAHPCASNFKTKSFLYENRIL